MPPDSTAAPTIDVERIRVRIERDVVEMLHRAPVFDLFVRGNTLIATDPIRRELLAQGLRLTETMAPELYASASLAASRLGVTTPCEIYQSAAARENAAIHLVETPVLLEVQGRLLAGLDDATRLCVLGHELGHYLAHGPWTRIGRAALAARRLAALRDADAGLIRASSVLLMAGELTADRFGLLACRDLDAALRLEMMSATGLSGDALTWDTKAYLAQVTQLVTESLAAGESARGITHPEHGLRAYAISLFAESVEYKALTGLGSGTRTLDEIDAILERFFAREELDCDFDVLDAPPPELHECALAGAVLVALADGDLVDDEALAIERIFAPLVPDFRRVLDREVALEVFYKTGGVVSAHGPATLRSLFQLLVHVMVADGRTDEREAAMVLSIGEALGCLPMFESWLDAALRGLGVSFPKVVERPVLPLPPRFAEAGAALEAFFEGMERRGGGECTLRRAARLLGVASPTQDTVAKVGAAATSAGLVAAKSFDVARLDDRVAFTVVEKRVAEPVRKAIDDADRRSLIRAITRLRDELVSGDGRSPSVRVREARRGRCFDLASLDKVSTGLAERVLAQVRAGKRASLVNADEVGRHEPAKRLADELVELDREHTTRVEETGADDLYLGYPVLTGLAGGYFYRAPLLLHPVDLVRDARGARGFAMVPRADEPPVVNQSLIRLVFHKKQFALPEALRNKLDELAADEASGAEAVIAELSSLGLGPVTLQGAIVPLRNRTDELAQKKDHCEIEECALLGLFPQSGSDLLQDYDALLDDLQKPDADLRRLLGAAEALLPARLRTDRDTEKPSDDHVKPALHADPSQRDVMNEARRTRALVVDGPPGTGKSQVIANIVVDAILRGERVAVVCEKRAALDVVVQRIDQLGLRNALGVVHDVHYDRKGLYKQVAERLEAEPTAAFDAAKDEVVEREARQIETVLGDRTTRLASSVRGTNLSLGQLHTYAAGIEAPDLGRGHALDVDDATLDALEHALLDIVPYADLRPGRSPLAGPVGGPRRPSLAKVEATTLETLRAEITRAVELARTHERLVEASGVNAADIVRVAPQLEAAVASRAHRRDMEGQRLFSQLFAAAERGAPLQPAQSSAIEWHRHRDAALAVGTQVTEPPDDELERRAGVLRAWAGRFLRFFVIAWWSARSFVTQRIPKYLPEREGHPLDASVLVALRDKLGAARAWAALRSGLDAVTTAVLVPNTALEADVVATRITPLAQLASGLIETKALLTRAGAYPETTNVDAVVAWDEALDQRLALRDAAAALFHATEDVRARFPWLEAHPSSEVLAAIADALARDHGRIVEHDIRLDRARGIFSGADAVFDALVAIAPSDPELFGAALSRTWAHDVLAALARQDPKTTELEGAPSLGTETKLATRLAELEKARAQIVVERVRASLDGGALLQAGQAAPRKRRTASQSIREGMLKEAKKQRRVMPLRSFVRRFAAEGLLDVVPVWLLSPETMTILFPREPLFDVVIFDEASQCTVESGFPVLLRATRVVIAGDDKQMPPTSFFASSSDGDDDEDVEVRDDRDLLADESLLTLASTRVPRRGLAWHYRCRHESLIAFSNHSMYEGQLLTIPSIASPSAKSPLRWHAVTAGAYEEGRNRVEAEEVVTLLAGFLERSDPPSVGVVTFNLTHRAAVLEAIDSRRTSDAAFGVRWDAACAQAQIDRHPFVKNLESVQGDERDVIIFSLGHAPIERRRRDGTGERYVPARFGPLGLRGGERRLNVAISRAKSECVVVASFEPSMLTVASSQNAGPGLFKKFLEYAFHMSSGRRAQAERTLALARDSVTAHASRTARILLRRRYVPLATQIAFALEAEGVASEVDVGTSKFRVPLAIVHPTDPTTFALAVMTDEGETTPSPFELHVHRPFALRERGFDVMRVTAAEWRARRAGVLDEIRERLAVAARRADG